MIELLSGYLIGVLTSITAWYVLYHRIIPSLEFFPEIYKSQTDENQSGYKYRVRFQNNGSREILDLELFAKLRIKGLSERNPSTWRAIYIPIDDPRIPRLTSQKGTNKRFAVQLLVLEISDSSRRFLPSSLQEKCQNQELTLEDLMQLGTQSTLEIIGFGYDAFSSARKIFESKIYSIQDIRNE